jgi:tRNA A37 threonylcarbamoyladenosine biosynthesis protein TsaE
MYRISGEDDLYSIGFDDYVDSGICLSEWSENIEFALPDEYIRVEISRVSSDDVDFSKRRVDAKMIRN